MPPLPRWPASPRRRGGPVVDPVKMGIRVGKAVGEHKMAKISPSPSTSAPGRLPFAHDRAAIDAEAALDAVYVLRTNASAEALDTAAVVRAYTDGRSNRPSFCAPPRRIRHGRSQPGGYRGATGRCARTHAGLTP
jgi:hypothetical protein